MRKILIVGNPNVGKSTLFNSLTKSSEHTGNFHGVTVDEKSKVVEFEKEKIEFVDLPGLYSLNSLSYEEELASKILINNKADILMLTDANSLRKNLYLCQQLNEIGKNYKILLNNYDFFKKHDNKIDFNKLKNKLEKDILIINAKKEKLNKEIINFDNEKIKNNYKYLEKYIKNAQNRYKIDEKTIIFALNGIFFNLNEEQINYFKSQLLEIVKDRYAYIDSILFDCLKIEKNYVYGQSKWDKILLNPFFAMAGFLLFFFVSFYAIFFLIGPLFSSLEEKILTTLIINPIMNFLYAITDNIWLIEFVKNGVFNSVLSVISFVPQVTLLFIFLTILEDSGIIARLAYVFDDFLNFFGLNGKVLYIMLLGLGCNTMSTSACRNMSDKNLKTKSAIVNPYISCMARFPVFALIASTMFGKKSFLIVASLYVLGFIIALVMSAILNKTILKTKSNELLLEFPPLRHIDIGHVLKVAKLNAVDFFKRVFTIILSMGIIVWILTHTGFNLQYTQNISNSILFYLADKISFIFKPIGLNNAGIVTALIVGIMAKELIVSTISICNNVSTQTSLKASLLSLTSVIHFSIPSAVSFLIFSLLYCPCVSNLAVIKKETDKFFMWFSLIGQFTLAYVISMVFYQGLTRGWLFSLLIMLVIALISLAIYFVIKQFSKKCIRSCANCRLNKKS